MRPFDCFVSDRYSIHECTGYLIGMDCLWNLFAAFGGSFYRRTEPGSRHYLFTG